MAAHAHLVFVMDPQLDAARTASHHARPYLRGRTDLADERGLEDSGPVELLDHADPRPHRDADHGHPHARGTEDQGGDVDQIQQIGRQVESLLAAVPGTRNVFAERTGDGYFLDVTWDRKALAANGLSIEDAQNALSTAVGGDNVSMTIEGRERYPINVRYKRDFRSDVEALGKVLVSANGDKQIPLAELATIRMLNGPSMIRNEDGLLTGYVFVDLANRAPGDYVEQARQVLNDKLKLPAGYSVLWSGQYESAERVRQRLTIVIPVTLAMILF